MQYTLRPARTTDLTAMYAVSQATHSSAYYDQLIPADFRQAYDERYRKTVAHQQEFVATMSRCVADSEWEVWVATDEQQAIVGYTLAQQSSPAKRLLKGLFVHPDSHGKGIGKKLFERSLQSTPAGCVVELTVIATNTVAKELYANHGFVVSGPAEKLFYGAPQEVMRRQIY